MKNIAYLAIILLSPLAAAAPGSGSTKGSKTAEEVAAAAKELSAALEGTWYLDDDKGVRGLKVFNKGVLSVTRVQMSTGNVISHSFGKYEFIGDVLQEQAVYATGDWAKNKGRTWHTSIVMKDPNTFVQTFVNKEEQTWKRVASLETQTVAQ